MLISNQIFARHGDMLYRFALALLDDEAAVERVLRRVAAQLPVAPLDETALLALLLAAAHYDAAHAKRRWRRRAALRRFGPFALQSLPLDERAALVSHLLLGYGSARVARLLNLPLDEAQRMLMAAVRSLGPAVGQALTDQISDEQCAVVRAAIIDPAVGSRQSATARGHLAACSHCRAFDHAWHSITQAVEATLRNALRDVVLPDSMAARLQPRPRRTFAWVWLRPAIAPAIVLVLIVSLVLPGFLDEPVRIVERNADAATVDPLELLDQALARHANPPQRDGVWYGRYETAWYFDNNLFAPLVAEVWLDPNQAARHRLQFRHRDGGAPYELQLGDGERRLSYALDKDYAPALYGGLSVRSRDASPLLRSQILDPTAQQLARDERLATGPWRLAPTYLRQARTASDLRLLGRQRDERRTLQILSFSALSPLGYPPDSPQAEGERVTIILALDTEDGLLRRVTELVGPTGGTQVSRVTWNLVAEEWLVGSQAIRDVFTIERAWTGLGSFNEIVAQPSADPALPLLSASMIAAPERLLDPETIPIWLPRRIWLPNRPPPGVDRAFLIWPNPQTGMINEVEGLIYLGPGRRLIFSFNYYPFMLGGTNERIGPWDMSFVAGRTARYSVLLTREPESPHNPNLPDPSLQVRLDAWGFSRAELEEVIASMEPFSAASLEAHAGMFGR